MTCEYDYFEAIKYVLETGEELYNIKNKRKMYRSKYGDVKIAYDSWEEYCPMNEKHLNSKWTSNKKELFNVRVYLNNNLIYTCTQHVLDINDNLKKMSNGILLKLCNKFNCSADEFKLVIEKYKKISL